MLTRRLSELCRVSKHTCASECCHAQSHVQLCRMGIAHQHMTVILGVRLPLISVISLLPDRQANPRHNSTALHTLRDITD